MHLSLFTLSTSFALLSLTNAQQQPPPSKYGIIIFPAFQALDVFGPLDTLNMLSLSQNLSLSILSHNHSAVSTQLLTMNAAGSHFSESIIPTHTFATAPQDLEVLIVPGGAGTRALAATNGDEEAIVEAVQFIRRVYPRLRYLITVCTGAALAARAGVLDGKRATTNKRAWAWATSQGPNVTWVPKARWVVDGNIWTSSGVSAGMDLTFAFVGHLYGEEQAALLANGSEYNRVTDPSDDPFSAYWNVTGSL